MADKVDTGRTGKAGVRSKRKKIDLNVPQVAGSAVAAVVAAKLASSFGVYGTILGAGLVSVIATCGGSVFQHFFSRTGEQVREVAEKAKPRGRQVPLTADGRPVPATFRAQAATASSGTGSARAATAGPVTTSWRPGVVTAEGDATTALPATGAGTGAADRTQLVTALDADRTQVLAPASGPDADRTQALTPVSGPDADRTQLLTPVSDPGPGADATTLLPQADETMLLRANAGRPAATPGSDEETRLLGTASSAAPVPVQGRRIKSWKRPLLGAALIFGVTMAGISTYELVSGDSFSGNDSQVLRPSSWGGSSSGEQRDGTPDDGPAQSTTTDDGGAGSGEQNPATDPTATPGRGSDGTAPKPEPSPSQSSDAEPTPEPSPSQSEADPTPEPSSPEPSESASGADQERGVAPTE